MKVIKKVPGSAPVLVDIDNTLEVLQREVGGYIETFTFASDACVVCNKKGHLLGLPYCATVLGVEFVGPILIVGVDGEEFCDTPKPTATTWHVLKEVLTQEE